MGSLADKTALVTGATDGLGLQVARELAREGATVLVHGRNPSKLERVLVQIPAGSDGEPRGYLANFGSLDEVRRLGRDVIGEHDRLDILVNNAGIAPMGGREESRDGYELVFAVNHLSHFLLTGMLLPLLGERPSRIVNVASMGQRAIDFDDVMLERGWDGWTAYMQSKLAQVMFTFELARRLGDGATTTVTALHPATFMDTNMVRGFGGEARSTVAEGCEATVHLAAGEDVEGVTGEYFDGDQPARADDQAYDEDACRRLWELSAELTGIDPA